MKLGYVHFISFEESAKSLIGSMSKKEAVVALDEIMNHTPRTWNSVVLGKNNVQGKTEPQD